MYQLRRSALLITSALALVTLSSCTSRNHEAKPVVRVHSFKSGGVETLSYTMKVNFSDHSNGLTASTPNLKVAFRFKDGTVVSRIDIPESYFPDGKARILMVDQTHRRSAVLLRRGLRADASLDADALSQAMFGATLDLGVMDARKPFRRISASDFAVRMRGLAFDVSQSAGNRVIATRTITLPQGGTREFTLVFDGSVGAVVEATEEGSLPEIQYVADSKVSYTSHSLDDGSVLVIPYEVNIEVAGNLQGEAALPAVEMPSADAVLAEGEELQISDNEYVAEEFTAPPGEGRVDPNHQAQSIQVRMEDIEINQISDDYFLIGRW